MSNEIRHRSRQEQPVLTSVSTATWSTKYGGPWGQPRRASASSTFIPEIREMWDTKTPNYFRRKANNEVLPINPLTVTRKLCDIEPGNLAVSLSYGPPYRNFYAMTGDVVFNTAWRQKVPSASNIFNFGPSTSEVNALAIEAIANARQKLFDGLTFAAELRKTAEMLHTTVGRYTQRVVQVEERARTIWRTTKRKRLASQNLTSLADVFGSTWMEYRYGWTPLSYEVKALYQQILALESIYNRVRASAASDPVIVTEKGGSVTGQNGIWLGSSFLSGGYLWESRTTSRSSYTMRSTAMIEMDSAFQVTLDPLITAWEIVPYSWMMDWFVNVGNLIRTFSPFARGNLVSCGVTTTKSNMTRTSVSTYAPDSNWSVITNEPSVGTVEMLQITRQAHTPSFELDFGVDINIWRALDVVSLAVRRLDVVLRLLPGLERVTLGNLIDAYKNINRRSR